VNSAKYVGLDVHQTIVVAVVDSSGSHVDQLVVCSPRKNPPLKYGNKSNRIDARKLARPITRQSSEVGLPWQDRRAHAGTLPELSDHREAALAKDIKPTMARLTLARKFAAITLTLWKKEENFDADRPPRRAKQKSG